MPQESNSSFRQQLKITWDDDGGKEVTAVQTKMVRLTNLGNSDEEITSYNSTDDSSAFNSNSFTKFITAGIPQAHGDRKDIWIAHAPRHANHPAEWYTELVWTVKIFTQVRIPGRYVFRCTRVPTQPQVPKKVSNALKSNHTYT